MIHNISLSSFSSALHSHNYNQFGWPSVYNGNTHFLEHFLRDPNEYFELSHKIDYICTVAEMHSQSPLTKFTSIECFLRIYLQSKMNLNSRATEATLLSCLELSSKFCEDVGYSLSANIIQKSHGVTDDGMSRFLLKSVVESEIITFQALNYCVDFQDSFFLFVEVLIYGICWEEIEVNVELIYDLCEKLSSMIYIHGFQSILLKYEREFIAAGVVLASLRILGAGNDDSLLLVTVLSSLTKFCQCESASCDVLLLSNDILSLVLGSKIAHSLKKQSS